MAGIATDTTDDAGGVVLAFGAVVFAVTNLATILAGLVLVVAQGTVESGKLAKLVSLKLILSFGNGRSLSVD